MIYLQAFGLLNILRCIDVYRFLETHENLPFGCEPLEDEDSQVEFISKVRQLWTESADTLKDFAEKVDRDPNPILKKLEDLLINFYEDKKARGILLVQMRFSTKALLEFIETSGRLEGKGTYL
jgi:hypothetical protein